MRSLWFPFERPALFAVILGAWTGGCLAPARPASEASVEEIAQTSGTVAFTGSFAALADALAARAAALEARVRLRQPARIVLVVSPGGVIDVRESDRGLHVKTRMADVAVEPRVERVLREISRLALATPKSAPTNPEE